MGFCPLAILDQNADPPARVAGTHTPQRIPFILPGNVFFLLFDGITLPATGEIATKSVGFQSPDHIEIGD
jgi:hypothetical protein